jgi:signal transduction histidine kinase
MSTEATTVLDVNVTPRRAQRYGGRIRWLWFGGSLLLSCSGSAINFFNLGITTSLTEFLLSWLTILLVSTGVMVLFCMHEAQRLAALELIDQERHKRERLAAQLVAIKATARAIAHALNQPLAVIRGVTELIQTAPSGETHARDLVQILTATDHAASLVRDLLRVVRYSPSWLRMGTPSWI